MLRSGSPSRPVPSYQDTTQGPVGSSICPSTILLTSISASTPASGMTIATGISGWTAVAVLVRPREPAFVAPGSASPHTGSCAPVFARASRPAPAMTTPPSMAPIRFLRVCFIRSFPCAYHYLEPCDAEFFDPHKCIRKRPRRRQALAKSHSACGRPDRLDISAGSRGHDDRILLNSPMLPEGGREERHRQHTQHLRADLATARCVMPAQGRSGAGIRQVDALVALIEEHIRVLAATDDDAAAVVDPLGRRAAPDAGFLIELVVPVRQRFEDQHAVVVRRSALAERAVAGGQGVGRAGRARHALALPVLDRAGVAFAKELAD